MKTIKEFFKHPVIQIAIAQGTSIIILAWVSKKVLPEPMSDVVLSLPPLIIISLHQYLSYKYKDPKITTTWHWFVAIWVVTLLIILYHIMKYNILF